MSSASSTVKTPACCAWRTRSRSLVAVLPAPTFFDFSAACNFASADSAANVAASASSITPPHRSSLRPQFAANTCLPSAGRAWRKARSGTLPPHAQHVRRHHIRTTRRKNNPRQQPGRGLVRKVGQHAFKRLLRTEHRIPDCPANWAPSPARQRQTSAWKIFAPLAKRISRKFQPVIATLNDHAKKPFVFDILPSLRR